MRKPRIGLCFLVLAIALLASRAWSIPDVFVDEATFLAAASPEVTTVFDLPPDSIVGSGVLSIDGVEYSSQFPETTQWVANRSSQEGWPGLTWNGIGDVTIRFAAGASVPAFGLMLYSGSGTAAVDVRVTGTGGQELTERAEFTPGSPAYRGFVDPEGIASIVLDPASTTTGGVRNHSFGRISRGKLVSEPSAGWLLASLAASLGWIRACHDASRSTRWIDAAAAGPCG